MAANIEIRVNGEERSVSDGMTIHQLLQGFDLQPAMVVVEHNGDIVRRERYTVIPVHAGDSFELVHFVGGG